MEAILAEREQKVAMVLSVAASDSGEAKIIQGENGSNRRWFLCCHLFWDFDVVSVMLLRVFRVQRNVKQNKIIVLGRFEFQ